MCLALLKLYFLPHQDFLKNLLRKAVELGYLDFNHMHILVTVTQINMSVLKLYLRRQVKEGLYYKINEGIL